MGKKKIGRNDPCPCGSGKKYKYCCGKTAQPPVDLFWKRVGESLQKCTDELFKFSVKKAGNYAYSMAVDEFFLWPEETEVLEDLLEEHFPIFLPWYLHNWYFDPNELESQEDEVKINLPPHRTISEMYLKEESKRLDSLQQRILEANLRRPYSFYEIIECRTGEGFTLRDLFLEENLRVSEKRGSENISPGNILFARTLTLDGLTILDGCGTVAIPPKYKREILELRDKMRNFHTFLTVESLNEYDVEIRDLYFYIYENLHQIPEIRNYDGDEILYTTLYFEIDDPEIAFEKLAPLAKSWTHKEMLENALYDQEGHLRQAQIEWERKKKRDEPGQAYVLLGTLEIDRNEMTVEVNSRERAKKIEREIRKRLGKHARLTKKEERSLDEVIQSRQDGEWEKNESFSQTQFLDPEILEKIKGVYLKHWEKWLDIPVPALNGKTPREAAKTTEGRERLKTILQDAAEAAKKDQRQEISDFQLELFRKVEKELGLDEAH